MIYERAESNEGSTKETEAERVSYDGGSEIDCESGTSVVLLGHSSTHGLTARLKAMLRFKREPRRFGFFFFFLCLPNIFIYFSVPIIYLFVSLCFDTPCTATGVMLDDDGVDDAPSPPSLPFAFNAAAVGNQTALKQIDVLFNIVVTSSQGPRASALVTTAGLLSLAPQWLTLCWSLQ